jgi:hypothetical protein
VSLLRKHKTSLLAGYCHFTLLAVVAFRLNAAEVTGKLAREYDLKAAFLFNFAHFVEWPAGAFADTNAPIVIGILGDDPFGPLLDKIVEGETIQNRRLIIKRSHQVEDLKNCHVLFICKSEKGHIDQILDSLGDASIFTVCESEGFARRGGITNLFLQGNKVRFEINAQTAHRKGLKISSQLLALGANVGSPVAKEID